MVFIRWLIRQAVELLKTYWKRRPKTYVQFSRALLVAGTTLLAFSPIQFVLENAVKIVRPDNSADYGEVDRYIGGGLFFAAVLTFAVCYWLDSDRRKPTLVDEGVSVGIPKGWTFRRAADTIALLAGKPIFYVGFAEGELELAVEERQLRAPSFESLLEALAYIITDGKLLSYDVLHEASVIRLKRHELLPVPVPEQHGDRVS